MTAICKVCGRRGHASSRCPTKKPAVPPASFTAEELAFFQVPRTWEEINDRFGVVKGKAGDDLTAIIESVLDADCHGGRGLLDWCRLTRTWRLTEAGRAWTDWMALA